MEIGSREWLIVGAIIFILLIVIDGWRRMRAQSNSLKIDIDDKIAELGDDNYNPELPIGSARVFVHKDKTPKTDGEISELLSTNNTFKNKSLDSLDSDEQNIQLNADISKNTEVQKVTIKESSTQKNNISSQHLNIPDILTSKKNPVSPPINSTFDSFDDSTLEIEINNIAPEEIKEEYSDSLVNLGNVDGILNNQVPITESQEQSISEFSTATTIDYEKQTSEVINENHLNNMNIISPDDNHLTDETLHEEVIHSTIKKTDLVNEPSEAIRVTDELSETALNSEFEKESISAIENKLSSSSYDEESFDKAEELMSALKADNSLIKDEIDNLNRDLAVDSFEQLLAERGLHSDDIKKSTDSSDVTNTDVNEEIGQQTPIENHIENTAESLSEEAKDHEIAALKARLKKLSEDTVEQSVDDSNNAEPIDITDDKSDSVSPSSIESNKSHKEIAAIEQILESQDKLLDNSLVLDDVEDVTEDEETEDNHTENISSDVRELLAHNETTVIDDEVDLSDFDEELTNISAEKVLEQLDDLPNDDNTDEHLNDFNQESANSLLFEMDESVNALSGLSALSSAESTNLPDVEQATRKKPVFDENADPLMDGYQDGMSSKELIEQFNHDLEEDEQIVSNELDMPITEILKKKKLIEDKNNALNAKESVSVKEKEGSRVKDSNQNELFNSKKIVAERDDEDNITNDQKITADLGFSAFDEDLLDEKPDREIERIVEEYLEEDIDELVEEEGSSQADISKDINSFSDTDQTNLFEENMDDLEERKESIKSSNVSEKVIKKPRKPITNIDDPEVVLIVTVVAKDNYLDCQTLKQVVEACGMEFGDMDVFHRFEKNKDEGAIQFSMANAVNPGTFDIETMEESTTPGVSFFMSMDEPLDAKNALDCMLATAETVANHLNGDLLDDERSVLRPQTKEHYRERIRIHEMNKLRRRAQ